MIFEVLRFSRAEARPSLDWFFTGTLFFPKLLVFGLDMGHCSIDRLFFGWEHRDMVRFESSRHEFKRFGDGLERSHETLFLFRSHGVFP